MNDLPNGITPEMVKGYECRNVTYCPSRNRPNDLLVVKEYIHTNDNRRIPRIGKIFDYKREFWVTKEGYRKHKDKLEWDLESRLQRYTSTQIRLPEAIARALGKPGVKQPLRQLANSPYLYGCDIGPGPLLKKEYATRYPDCIHPEASVAVLDIETDVLYGTEDIILITLSFKDRVITAATRQYVGKMVDPEATIQRAFEKYLGEYKASRNINLEIIITDTPGQAVKAVIDKAHEWMPDFVIFWNMNFDLPKMIAALEKEQYSLGDVFSDPSVPYEYRFFKYTEGPSQKVTASGKVMALHPADRWHVADFPASFYFLDAMCLYKRIRTAKGNEPSYSLDAILKKNLALGKLKFEEADHVAGLAWHQLMQDQYKAEYAVYNIFDCIGVELLDEKTGDVSRAFSVLCEFSDFSNFKSTPRRISDDMHFFVREHGRVIATTSADMVDELDEHVVSMKDWINCIC